MVTKVVIPMFCLSRATCTSVGTPCLVFEWCVLCLCPIRLGDNVINTVEYNIAGILPIIR